MRWLWREEKFSTSSSLLSFVCFCLFCWGLIMSGELFHVYQKFANGGQEQVRSFVPEDEAVRAARHYCTSVGAKLGMTTEVLIVDLMDCCCFHWRYGEGVVHPVPAKSDSI